MNDLRVINDVRNKLTHGGSELAEALDKLDIEYPIRNYVQAWDQPRSKAAAALTTIRSALQSASVSHLRSRSLDGSIGSMA